MSTPIYLQFIDSQLSEPIEFSLSKEINQTLLNKAISSKFKRKFKSEFVYFISQKIDEEKKITCAWCGDINHTAVADYDINFAALTVTIKNIRYKKPLNCCYKANNNCAYKALNANSIEFVSKSRGLSECQANDFILTRNKSPFYSNNHDNPNEYKKYQGSRCYSDDVIKNQEIIDKQNFSRSLEGFQSRYGEIEGKEKYEVYCKRKGITLENLTTKYKDPLVAEQKLNAWKKATCLTLENFIKKYGEQDGTLRYKDAVKHGGKFSKITFAHDGSALRSNNERKFYESLIAQGFPSSEILIDNAYPNSSLRYDFYIRPLNLFVEIAGMTDSCYNEKMEYKQKTFGAMIVRPKQIPQTVEMILNFYKFKKEQSDV